MNNQDKNTIDNKVNEEKVIPQHPGSEHGIKVIAYKHLTNASKYNCIIAPGRQLLVRDGAPYLIHRKDYITALKIAKANNATIMRADKALEAAIRSGLTIYWLKIVEKA